MFGKKKCKNCKTTVAKKDLVTHEYCTVECRDEWQDKNLRPFQKAFVNSVDKWTKKPNK